MGVLPQAEPAQFERLYALYGDDVLRLAYFYLADRQQAEDAAQDVFLRLYQRAGEITPGKEKAWLMQVTVNRCRDTWRSAWARRVLLGSPQLELVPARENDELERREEKEALLRAVHRLPPDFREVVLLHYYQQMPLEETAAALGIPQGTAASRLARAKDKLKKMLKEEGFDG